MILNYGISFYDKPFSSHLQIRARNLYGFFFFLIYMKYTLNPTHERFYCIFFLYLGSAGAGSLTKSKKQLLGLWKRETQTWQLTKGRKKILQTKYNLSELKLTNLGPYISYSPWNSATSSMHSSNLVAGEYLLVPWSMINPYRAAGQVLWICARVWMRSGTLFPIH